MMGLARCFCSTWRSTPVRTTTMPTARIRSALKMVNFTLMDASLRDRGNPNPFPPFLMISILLILIYLPLQTFAQEKRFEFEKGLMGSKFRLVFYASSDSLARLAAAQAFGRIDTLNEILSDYRDGSEINRLSAQSGSGKWVCVSEDLYRVVSTSKEISQKTGGVFDITIGPVVQLWRRALRRSQFPVQKELDEALASVGYQKIALRPKKRAIRLSNSRMRLDVGGIGKGYAADEAVRILKGLGIASILVDAGGDLTLADPPPGKAGWEVEITSGTPQDSTATLLLANVGIATSGASYRYLEHNGIRYSHIVNPNTGVGLRYHVRTTVIAPSGTLADALATALSVAGISKAREISRAFPGVRVWLLETNGSEVKSWNTLK
jgi:FAD:protein FMN transferase